MSRHGFTLLELLLVMAILAVISAMAVPRYMGSLQRYRVDAAARRVAADVALAQSRANSTSSTQVIAFDPPSSSYQIQGMNDPDHPTQGYIVQIGGPPYQARILSADFTGGQQITFDGVGSPDRGGSVVLDVAGQRRTVVVDGSSGKTTIQ